MFNYHDMLSLLTHILIRRATSIVVVRQRILIASESFFFLISSATRLYNYLPVYGVNTYLAGSRKSVTIPAATSLSSPHTDVSQTSLWRISDVSDVSRTSRRDPVRRWLPAAITLSCRLASLFIYY